MSEPPELEARLGIEVYSTGTPGVGGRIRQTPEDFIVEEILTDGTTAKVDLSEIEEPGGLRGWGRHLLCIMVKRNRDTMITVRRIAEKLGINWRMIHIAGIKDTRALTAQFITISTVKLELLPKLRIDGTIIRPLRFLNEAISQRNLFGNHFHVTIRSIKLKPEVVRERIDRTVQDLERYGGLPNYFGHQRFGTVRPITHLIGRSIVKGDYKTAVSLFLSHRGGSEDQATEEARYLSGIGEYRKALKLFPRHLSYERAILKYLVKYPRDYVGALMRLPVELRRLMVQAYQSYLYNRFLSRRIREGVPLNKAQVGDYILELDELGLPTERSVKASSGDLQEINREIAKHGMGIAIPLIGFKQGPSDGIQGDIEREILESEGVKPGDFNIKDMRDASAPGSLRPVLAQVMDFTVEKVSEDSLNLGKLMVELDFVLHRGVYGTILLREVMKPRNLVRSGF